jgi:hypothetical protein
MAQVLVLYGERTRAVTQPQPQAPPPRWWPWRWPCAKPPTFAHGVSLREPRLKGWPCKASSLQWREHCNRFVIKKLFG